MARARNIKPGVFKNELLAEMPAFTRLLFIGLWTLADREGRLEDRPKRIKIELFPFDNDDIESALVALCEAGFIHRYSINGVSVISVVNFFKHQTPHGTEKDSDLPAQDGSITVNERKNGCITGTKRSVNVKSDGNNVRQPLVNGEPTVSSRPDLLIPDSLIPDSLNKEQSAAPPVADAPAPKKRSSGKSQAKTLDDWLTECEAKDEKPIPDNDTIREWAEHAGVPHEFMRLAWLVFVRDWQAKKPQADWRATFRNAVRKDWLKLWYFNADGECRLTVSGQQENKAHV